MGELQKVKAIIALMRPWQWYKNLLVFVPLVFGLKLLDLNSIVFAVLGFISFCLVSSAGYAFNDLVDARTDRFHPEKKSRPVASGRISSAECVLLSGVFLLGGIAVALGINMLFSLIALCLYLSFVIYSVWLKKEPVLDIIVIAVNYVLRAFAGVVAVGVSASPWLVLCTFFLAMFLGAGKRESERMLSGKANGYTSQLAGMMMTLSTALLLISYSLYSFFSKYPGLFITIPIAFYTVLRYAGMVYSGNIAGRHPHLALKDARLVTGIILWTAVSLAVLYA